MKPNYKASMQYIYDNHLIISYMNSAYYSPIDYLMSKGIIITKQYNRKDKHNATKF